MIVESLKRKDRAFAVLDTHAGLGVYDLTAGPADRTGEWRDGIGRVLAQAAPPPSLAPYLDVVRTGLDGAGGLTVYPGSPALVRALLRPQDRLAVVELHPEDHGLLKRRFARDPQVGVHHMDGYLALKALLPPPERRGAVLIDPPFETADERAHLARGLDLACRRWPGGHYLAWYPVKAGDGDSGRVGARFLADLAMLGLPPTLIVEMEVRDDPDGSGRLTGSGLAIVNPPWRLDEDLNVAMPWLTDALAGGGKGRWRLDWLVPPA